jgi:large subunit ribosomal protein L23
MSKIDLYDVIRKPLITEATMLLMDDKKYTFLVDVRATKTLVKKACEAVFADVKVEKVNIMNIKPKMKRRGRYMGLTNRKRKAIVKLTADSKDIKLFADEINNNQK